MTILLTGPLANLGAAFIQGLVETNSVKEALGYVNFKTLSGSIFAILPAK